MKKIRSRSKQSARLRNLFAIWRDTRLLLRQFRSPLLLFSIGIFSAGFLYQTLANAANQPVNGLPEGIYTVLGLAFLSPIGAFPSAWYLQIFYFLMPLFGIGMLAQGLADFGTLFFNRHARNKEWEMAVSSTFRNHVILIGLGHLGFRVLQNLHQLGQDVVGIEKNPKASLLDAVRQFNLPILEANGASEETLLAAGVKHAHTIMLCTQNDSLNLQMAVKARTLNPSIHVVIRIFDDDFAQALQSQFGFSALSATGMAAPAFAAAAAGVEMTRPLTVEGQPLSLARFTIHHHCQLCGQNVGDIEGNFDVSVVLLRRDGDADLHPAASRLLQSEDIVAILGGPKSISRLVQANEQSIS